MSYLDEVAQATSLQVYPKQGPFGTKEGSVIGVVNGYLSAFGTTKVKKASAVSLLIRFKKVGDSFPLIEAIQSSARVLEVLEEKKWPSKMHLTVGTDYLIFHWTYSLRKPSATRLVALQAAIVDAIHPFAAANSSTCEICEAASAPEIMLFNGMPGHYCASCQMQQAHNQQTADTEYANRDSNIILGLMYGTVAAILGALAWGLVAYGLNRIFLWGAVLIGYAIAWAVFKGAGKVNLLGQIGVCVLTVASVLLGDAIFFALSVAKEDNVALSFNLLSAVVTHLFAIEKESGNGLFTAGFALFGAFYAIYAKGRRPKFEARFETLGQSEALTQSAFAGK